MSNPAGKSAATKTFSKKKSTNPSDRVQTRQQTSVSLAAEARNTKADGNSLRSVSTPAMQGKKGNVNSKGRSVTGGASMGGMNIRGAGGLGKSKPKNVDIVVKKYKKQVSSDRKAAAKERAGMRAKGVKFESFSTFLEGDYHSGQGEKIQSRTKKYMEKKGQKGAPGLDAMKARTADHKARRGVKEEASDHIKDRRLEKYGIGHDGSDRKSTPSRSSDKKPKGKTVLQKETEKKYGKGKSALDIVKAKITAKHGKGAIMKNEEVISELSSDTLQKASKAADVDRGKKAVAGDKEGAKKRVGQASRFFKAASAKRKQEAKEEYTVTNADKKGNTPAWKG